MLSKQRGATFWQWLFVGGMTMVFLYVGIMLTPIYIENLAVKKALKNLEQGPVLKTKNDIRKRIMRQFDVDDVKNVSEKDIQIKRTSKGNQVVIEYAVKIPLVGNLSVIAEYYESAEF